MKDGAGEDALNVIRIFGLWKNGMERAVMQMARTINGEVLIDDYGNFNEQVWLENAIAVYALLLGEEKDGDENEHRH